MRWGDGVMGRGKEENGNSGTMESWEIRSG